MNEGKLPEQLRFFTGGNSGINKLRIYATNKLKSELNKSNKAFLDYLMSDNAREILAKNKIKIHLDTGNIFRDNANLEELELQNEAKKLLHYEFNFTGDFNSYINEIINLIADNIDDLHTHSASKFLFYHFNNLMHDLNEDSYKIRHTPISDDKYVLEFLQSMNWSYFIEKMLEVSQGNISSLNMNGASSNNLSEDVKIINDTKDILTICNNIYSYFYSNIGCALQRSLQATYKKHIERTEKDLAQNHYFTDLKYEENVEDIMRVFAEFLVTFGIFPGTIDHLPIVP